MSQITEQNVSELQVSEAASEFRDAQGVVKFFNDDRGFGYVTLQNGEGDVFVHHSVIESTGHRTLMDGEGVSVDFVFDEDKQRYRATRLIRKALG